MPRFFESLVSPKSEPASASSSLGIETEKLDGKSVDESVVVVNFSWESLLEFHEDQLTIVTAEGAPKPPPRKRPNYDNRKRRFMAAGEEGFSVEFQEDFVTL